MKAVLEAAEELRKAEERYVTVNKAVADLTARLNAAQRDRNIASAELSKTLGLLKAAVDTESKGN